MADPASTAISAGSQAVGGAFAAGGRAQANRAAGRQAAQLEPFVELLSNVDVSQLNQLGQQIAASGQAQADLGQQYSTALMDVGEQLAGAGRGAAAMGQELGAQIMGAGRAGQADIVRAAEQAAAGVTGAADVATGRVLGAGERAAAGVTGAAGLAGQQIMGAGERAAAGVTGAAAGVGQAGEQTRQQLLAEAERIRTGGDFGGLRGAARGELETGLSTLNAQLAASGLSGAGAGQRARRELQAATTAGLARDIAGERLAREQAAANLLARGGEFGLTGAQAELMGAGQAGEFTTGAAGLTGQLGAQAAGQAGQFLTGAAGQAGGFGTTAAGQAGQFTTQGTQAGLAQALSALTGGAGLSMQGQQTLLSALEGSAGATQVGAGLGMQGAQARTAGLESQAGLGQSTLATQLGALGQAANIVGSTPGYGYYDRQTGRVGSGK